MTEAATPVLVLALKLAVGVAILSIGMSATPADVAALWRRPALLARCLLAMYVLVPLAALALVAVLPLAPAVKAALLVLAVSSGAPLVPRKVSALGGGAHAFSLVVTSSLLAVVFVPLGLAVLARRFEAASGLDPLAAAAVLGKGFLLPMALGMALRALVPAIERLAPRLLALAGTVLAAAGLGLGVLHRRLFREVSLQGYGAMALFIVLALAIGHALGGPDPDGRTVLAVACATRHLGVALLVAAAFPGPRTPVLIAAYMLTTTAISVPYLAWRRRIPRGERT